MTAYEYIAHHEDNDRDAKRYASSPYGASIFGYAGRQASNARDGGPIFWGMGVGPFSK